MSSLLHGKGGVSLSKERRTPPPSPKGQGAPAPPTNGSTRATPILPGLFEAIRVERKPETYLIAGIKIGPDYEFTTAYQLKNRPYKIALSYLVQREFDRLGGLPLMCEIKDHPLSPNDITIHHRKSSLIHKARDMGLACFRHNSAHGQPGWSGNRTSREREITTAAHTHASSTELFKSEAMRPAWLSWIQDEEKGPLAHGAKLPLNDLTAHAPRALARHQLGEESLGVKQSYDKYVEQDTDSCGGPLHLYTRTNPKTHRLETWVRLATPEERKTAKPPIPELTGENRD